MSWVYIRQTDLAYPRYEGDIRRDFPDIPEGLTGDDFPCPETYAPVTWVDPPPILSPLQYVEQSPPQMVNGKWRMVWVANTRTQEEQDAIIARIAAASAPMPNIRDPARMQQTGSAPDVE